MEPEVLLANLSRDPAFPIAVPKCAYADFHHASGTGILITARIPFGQDPIEPHHPKCMDQLLPDPIGHYRVLIIALARLAGTHRSGRLGQAVENAFPLNVDALIKGTARHAGPPSGGFRHAIPASVSRTPCRPRVSGRVL
jgi:hypothetical protein